MQQRELPDQSLRDLSVMATSSVCGIPYHSLGGKLREGTIGLREGTIELREGLLN